MHKSGEWWPPGSNTFSWVSATETLQNIGSVLSLFTEHAETAASLSWKWDLMVRNWTRLLHATELVVAVAVVSLSRRLQMNSGANWHRFVGDSKHGLWVFTPRIVSGSFSITFNLENKLQASELGTLVLLTWNTYIVQPHIMCSPKFLKFWLHNFSPAQYSIGTKRPDYIAFFILTIEFKQCWFLCAFWMPMLGSKFQRFICNWPVGVQCKCTIQTLT